MAVELLSGKRLSTLKKEQDDSGMSGWSGLYADPSPIQPKIVSEGSHCPIEYDHEHDAESVWWIVPWSLTARIKYTPGQAYAATTFVNSMEIPSEKMLLFVSPSHLSQKMQEVLHPKLHRFIPPMVECSMALYNACVEKEEEKEDLSYYLRVHSFVARLLYECECLSMGQDLPELECLSAVILTKPPTEGGRKRSHSASSDDAHEAAASSSKSRRLQ